MLAVALVVLKKQVQLIVVNWNFDIQQFDFIKKLGRKTFSLLSVLSRSLASGKPSTGPGSSPGEDMESVQGLFLL